MLRYTEPFWSPLPKKYIFAWNILVIVESTVLSSFRVIRCNRISKIHNGPLFMLIQFLAQNACTAYCFNHRFLVPSSSQPDTSLSLLSSSLGISDSFTDSITCSPLCVFSFIILILALVLSSMHLCLWPISCSSLPPRATSQTILLSSFSFCPQFIAK